MGSTSGGRRRARWWLAGIGALALIGGLVAVSWRRADGPETVSQPVSRLPRPTLRLVDVGASGALAVRGEELVAVAADGSIAWQRSMPAGGASCFGCPGALLGPTDGRAAVRVDPAGQEQPVDALGDAISVGDLWLRPASGRLEVEAIGPAGVTALGTVSGRSLDPTSYAIAPSALAAADGRSAAAVVGLPDPLEPGRAEGWYLAADAEPTSVPIDLDATAGPPVACRPLAGSTRWGWLQARSGDEPWAGSAVLVPADGAVAGDPIELALPVSACTVVPDGYVLTVTSVGPNGTTAGAVWLDAEGHVRTSRLHRDQRTSSSVSVSASTGLVALPIDGGFELDDASGVVDSFAADDALLAPDGSLWVVQGTEVRRRAP